MAQVTIPPLCVEQNQVKHVVNDSTAHTGNDKPKMQKPKPPVKPRLKQMCSGTTNYRPVPPLRTASSLKDKELSDLNDTDSQEMQKLQPSPRARNRRSPFNKNISDTSSTCDSSGPPKLPAEFESVTLRDRSSPTESSLIRPNRPPRPKTSYLDTSTSSQSFDGIDYYDDTECHGVSETVPRIPPKKPGPSSQSNVERYGLKYFYGDK